MVPGVHEQFYVNVAATSDGDNTVVSGTAGKRIVVLGYTVGVNAAGVIKFTDSGTNTLATFDLLKETGLSYSGGPACPAFQAAVGKDLLINCATGVDATGHLTYTLVA